MKKEDCAICYKIICKKCKWEASDEEVLQIKKGEITTCPVCNWAPGEIL